MIYSNIIRIFKYILKRGIILSKEIKKRVLMIADYIIKTGSTIRNTAKVFNVSKSTIHKDIQVRLINIDVNRYCKIKKILEYHLQIRHINGGNSTRLLFLNKEMIICHS